MQKINLKLNGHDWQAHLRDEVDQSVFNEIFKLKEYRAANEVIKSAKDAIVDVGAHAGFFSMYCRALNEKVKIFAVEPEPKNLKLLKQNLDENKILGVKVIAGALAGETGERQLILSADSHNHRLGEADAVSSGSMFAEYADADDKDAEKTITVQAFSLADFCRKNKIKKISLLKMDIEGGEYELFDGMSADDFSMVNFIILEYHNGYGTRGKDARDLSRENGHYTSQTKEGGKQKELEEKLRANGFGVQVFPSNFDKTMGFIFANNKRI